MISPHHWSTTHILPSPSSSSSGSAGSANAPAPALIILNQPIPLHYLPILSSLWNKAGLTICADGGANRLYDFLESAASGQGKGKGRDGTGDEEIEQLRLRFLPTAIKGDLDSLRDDVKEYYASKGVQILHDPSEYSTDLQKCITHVEETEDPTLPPTPIIILGGLSGRLDQTTHVLHLLHKLRLRLKSPSTTPLTSSLSSTTSTAVPKEDKILQEGEKLKGDSDEPWWTPLRAGGERDVRVVSENCIAWVLDEGEHHIHVDHTRFGQTCGILPLGVEKAAVRTEGLKWDVDWITSFDTVVSTSNHLLPENEVVKVWTDKPVWWTMEIKEWE